MVKQRFKASFQCPNPSFLALPCFFFGCVLVLVCLAFLLFLWLHTSVFFKNTYQKLPAHITLACTFVLNGDSYIFCLRMPLFQEGPEKYCMFTTNGEVMLSRIPAFQLSENTGTDFPELSSVLIYVECLRFLKVCITICIGYEFCLYAYMICCPFLEVFYT